jgi:hypothetical protein
MLLCCEEPAFSEANVRGSPIRFSALELRRDVAVIDDLLFKASAADPGQLRAQAAGCIVCPSGKSDSHRPPKITIRPMNLTAHFHHLSRGP